MADIKRPPLADRLQAGLEETLAWARGENSGRVTVVEDNGHRHAPRSMTVQETRDQLRSDQLDNIHPGEVLRKEFLEPLGITPYRLAKSIGVAQTRVGEIMEGKRSISTDTAIRLGRFFNVTPQFWLGLQQAYDIEREQSNPIYDEIRPCESLPDAAA